MSDARPARPTPWWASLSLWRGLAFAGFATAFAFGFTLLAPRAERPDERIVVVLAAPDARPVMIASADRSGRYLTVKAIGTVPVPADGALELWVLPEGREPHSLGRVPATGIGRIPLGAPAGILFQKAPALGISVEPAKGAPSGKPTGTFLYSGTVQALY